MLSLSPRFDLFHFAIPKDYIPEEILTKYDGILNKNAAVITSAIEYLNESIVGVTLPGTSDFLTEQMQVSSNDIIPTDLSTTPSLHGKIHREPVHTNTTYAGENIIEHINREMTVTFRQNQGLLNYFMMYETLFYRYCKPYRYETDHDVFSLEVLDEAGSIISVIKMYQPKISAIDGLEFSYSKTERQGDTFSVTFTYNDIDFDFCMQ